MKNIPFAENASCVVAFVVLLVFAALFVTATVPSCCLHNACFQPQTKLCYIVVLATCVLLLAALHVVESRYNTLCE